MMRLILSVLMLTIGCSGGGSPAPGGGVDGAVAVPTSDARNAADARLDGRLHADGTNCLWVEGGDGEASVINVIWPPGYGARQGPQGIELLDENGTTAAREGDLLILGGSGTAAGPGCAPGNGDGPWIAGSVRVQEG